MIKPDLSLFESEILYCKVKLRDTYLNDY
jgi:hypothetical protein